MCVSIDSSKYNLWKVNGNCCQPPYTSVILSEIAKYGTLMFFPHSELKVFESRFQQQRRVMRPRNVFVLNTFAPLRSKGHHKFSFTSLYSSLLSSISCHRDPIYLS